MAPNKQFYFPLASDNWDSEEIESILSVIKSNKFTMGEEVKNFEKNMSSYLGSKYSVMVNSGSSANLLMLTALKILLSQNKIKKGNIIVPAVSWSTTFTPAYYLGLELRFCDIDRDHFGLNFENVERAITNDTVAILAVNLLGSPSDLVRLRKLAAERNIILLEDNCESLGAKLDGKFTGTFGLMGSNSSFYSHHINSMEGGWVTTDSYEMWEILSSLRTHGWTRQLDVTSKWRKKNVETEWFDSQFEFVLPGLNFRPIEMEGAIASVQLKKLDKMLTVRRNNAKLLIEALQNNDFVRLQNPLGDSSWFSFALIFPSTEIRNTIARKFKLANIECRPVVTGNFTRQPVMEFLDHTIADDLYYSNLIHDCGMYIGNHPHPLNSELDRVVEIISNTKNYEL